MLISFKRILPLLLEDVPFHIPGAKLIKQAVSGHMD
jgi:hypothetical protein